jgi:hypothetical protein
VHLGYVTIEVTRVDVVVFISSLDHRHGRILSRRRGERPGDHAQESLLLRHVSSVMKVYHFRNYLAYFAFAQKSFANGIEGISYDAVAGWQGNWALSSQERIHFPIVRQSK